MIEGMVRRIQDEAGEKMQVIATGGLAPLFTNSTDSIERSDINLTLYGLLSVHRRNQAP